MLYLDLQDASLHSLIILMLIRVPDGYASTWGLSRPTPPTKVNSKELSSRPRSLHCDYRILSHLYQE